MDISCPSCQTPLPPRDTQFHFRPNPWGSGGFGRHYTCPHCSVNLEKTSLFWTAWPTRFALLIALGVLIKISSYFGPLINPATQHAFILFFVPYFTLYVIGYRYWRQRSDKPLWKIYDPQNMDFTCPWCNLIYMPPPTMKRRYPILSQIRPRQQFYCNHCQGRVMRGREFAPGWLVLIGYGLTMALMINLFDYRDQFDSHLILFWITLALIFALCLVAIWIIGAAFAKRRRNYWQKDDYKI